jgi:hypothetical protein
MRVPGRQRKSYTWRWTAALAGLAVVVVAAVVAVVVAPFTGVRAASVTTLASATLSADTQAAAPGNGVYTSLTGPVIAEAAAGEVTVGTIVLSAPSGFEFRTTGTVTVSVSPTTSAGIKVDTDAGCGSADASEPANLTASTITISVCSVSTSASTITWSGIGVRPTGTGPTLPPFDLGSCGLPTWPTYDIFMSVASTSNITGITKGVTPLGHLAESSGAAATIFWSIPLPDGNVNTIVPPAPPGGQVCVEDQFGNPAVGSAMSWSITSAPAGATCQQLISPAATTDGAGHASTFLKLGNLNGNYEVSASSGAAGPTTDVSTASSGPGAPCGPVVTPTLTPTITPTFTPTVTGTPPTSTATATPTGTPPTSTPTHTPTPTAMESVTLVGGTCNPVASTYADNTPVATIAAAVSPSGILISIWNFDAGIWRGYSPQFPSVSDLTDIDRLDAFFLCVSSAGTWSRPVIG